MANNHNSPTAGAIPSTEEAQIEQFNRLLTNFEKVKASSSGEVIQFYKIGTHTVRMDFANDVLVPLVSSSLSHLKTTETPTPDLTIYFWDRGSDPTPTPYADDLMAELREDWRRLVDNRGEIIAYGNGRFRGAFRPGTSTLRVLDTVENRAIYWVNDVDQVPWFEAGSPLRFILNYWCSLRGYQYVHAGAVGIGTDGVLLAGRGGVGKSTSALACLSSELSYASDDYALVSTAPRPMVYSLYNTGKLKGDRDLERFPHLAPLLYNADRRSDEKAMFFLHKHLPHKVATHFEIKAILLPKVVGGSQTKLSPASAGDALFALAPSTLIQLAGAGGSAMRTMTQLIRQVPRYYLELGEDISQIPKTIRKLLKGDH